MGEINRDALYQSTSDPGLVREATSFPTVPKGKYLYYVEQVQTDDGTELPEFWDDGRPNAMYNREHARLWGRLEQDGVKKGHVGVRVSWKKKYNDRGRLDGPSSLWGQIEKSLEMEGQATGDILDATTKYPLLATVKENFRVTNFPEADEWKSAANEEERVALLKQGAVASNGVQSFARVK